MVTGFLLGIKRLGCGANPHSQVPSSWKGRAVPPLTLWATVACYRVNLILYLQHYFNQQFTAKPFKKFCKTLKKLYAADSPIMFILSLSVYLRFFFIRRRGNYKVLLRVQNDVKFLRLKKKQRHKDTINEDNVVTLLTVCNSSKFYSANTPHTHTHTHTQTHTHTHGYIATTKLLETLATEILLLSRNGSNARRREIGAKGILCGVDGKGSRLESLGRTLHCLWWMNISC